MFLHNFSTLRGNNIQNMEDKKYCSDETMNSKICDRECRNITFLHIGIKCDE